MKPLILAAATAAAALWGGAALAQPYGYYDQPGRWEYGFGFPIPGYSYVPYGYEGPWGGYGYYDYPRYPGYYGERGYYDHWRGRHDRDRDRDRDRHWRR